MSKIKNYLIYLFFFLLPWQTRWIIFESPIKRGVFEYSRISVYSFDVAFLMLVLILCLKYLFNKFSIFNSESSSGQVFKFLNNFKFLILRQAQDKFLKHKIKTIFFLILTFFIASNIFLAESRILTVYWWLRIMEGLVIFYLVKKMVESEKIKVVWSFIISLAISAGLGIYQFFTQNIFASKWLGLAWHKASELGASVIETTNGLRFLRAYGTFSHPNVLAGFILLAFLLLFWLQQKKAINKQMFFIFSILFVGGLFFTFSRSAWLAFLSINIGYIIYYIYDIYDQKKSSQKLIVKVKKNKIFFINWFIFLLLATIYWPLVSIRLGLAKETGRLEFLSINERISGYNEALQIIEHNPWGVGLGNYTQALQHLKPNQEIYYYQPVHNVFILILAELGLVFLFFLLIIIVYLILKTLNNNNKFLIIFYLILFIFLFCLDHFWWTSASGLIIMILSTGFLLSSKDSACPR